MSRKLICSLILSFACYIQSEAQVYDYNYGGRTDHAGVQFDVNQNMGSSLIDNDGTASKLAPFARVGVYMKRQFNPNWYFRAAMLFGNGNFSYKYPQKFLPTSDTTYPKTDKTNLGSRNISLLMLEPEIAIGHLFRFKKKHQIDVRLSVSAPIYLSTYNNYSDTTYGDVTLLGNDRMRYGTIDRFQINNDAKQWGVVNGNLYIGYKKIHYNDVSDRLGVGLIMGLSIPTNSSGLATFSGHNISYKYQMWENQHKLNYCYFGVRVEYDIF